MTTFTSAPERIDKDALLRDLIASHRVTAKLPDGSRQVLWTASTLPNPYRTLTISVADQAELEHVAALVAEHLLAPAAELPKSQRCSLERLEHDISLADAVAIRFRNRPDEPALRIWTRNPGKPCPELTIWAKSEREFLQVCALTFRTHFEQRA